MKWWKKEKKNKNKNIAHTQRNIVHMQKCRSILILRWHEMAICYPTITNNSQQLEMIQKDKSSKKKNKKKEHTTIDK